MSITTILIIINVFAAIAMIALTLMQSSKGDMGSAFGGGGSQSMFGSRGSSNFLSKSTAIMCTVFFITSIALAYTYAQRGGNSIVEESVIEQSNEIQSIEVPSAEVTPNVEVPTAESIESAAEAAVEALDIPAAVTEQIESGEQQLEELKSQVEGAIEEAKEKVGE